MRKPPNTPRVGHFKPDYAPEYLMAVNYICHLAVFKKELFEAVEASTREYNSQPRIMTFSCGLSMKCSAATLPPSRCMSRRCVLLAGACGLHQRRHRG